MRQFFSPRFPSYDPLPLDVLIRGWPMHGDRAWAERCLAWLDGYVTAKPSVDNAYAVVWQGYHVSVLLEYGHQYPELVIALRDELVRRLENWNDSFHRYPFEKEYE